MSSLDLTKLTKSQLLTKCEELGILKCKSKNKEQLIELINKNSHSNTIYDNNSDSINIQNIDGLEYLKTIENNSIDLILTDPPYIISKDSGMNKHYENIKYIEENNIDYVKSEEEWEEYKKKNNIFK